nr:MAG TPA: minor tail protein [Caudoviricetes sp.]
MSNVAAISGATGDDLKSLTDKAKEMGAKTKFSATESAEAFSYMAMAGWKTTDMLEGIEGIMNLAAASGEDLATTSDIVTDALTAFGLSAKDSTHFADVLAQASSNANTNVGLMGETFKYVAPVAGALGFSAEDCATAIGLMANSGIKASQAGTSLRSIITRMAKPTKDVQGAMDALGVSLTNSDGSMKSLNEIMVDLRKGFAGLTADQKAQMAATLGGQEAMSGLLAIVNASDEDFASLTDSIANCDGAAQKMADTMNDNLSGQITILKSGLEGLAISLYEEMATPLKNVVKVAQEMVQGLQEAFNDGGLDALVDKTGDVMAEIVTRVAQAAPELIGTAEDLVGAFIQTLLEQKEEFASAGAFMVSELAKAIMNVAGDMWSAGIYIFTEFLKALTDHSEELGSSFGEMLSKIGEAVQENLPLIIQAGKDFIAGFCRGLSEEFPGVSALLDGFFDGLLSTVGAVAQSVVDLLSKIFGVIDAQDPAVMEAIGKAIGTIAGALISLNAAKNVAGSLNTLFSVLGSVKGGITGITGVVGKAVEGFSLWRGEAGTLMEVLELEFPKVASIISSIGGAVQKAIGFVTQFGTSIAGIGSIIGGAILAVTSFVDMFQNGFSVIKEILMGVGVALAAVGAVILGAPAAVAAVVAGIVFAVANLAIAVKQHWDEILAFVQEIPSKIGEVVDAVVDWFQALPGRISAFLEEIIVGVQTWASNLLSQASSAAENAVNAVENFFSNLPYKIGYILGFVIGKLVSFGVDAINWVTKNVPIIINNIVTFFSQLPGKVWTWLVNTYNKLVTWGGNMLQKASEAARNVVENVSTFFSELPGKVARWLQNTLTNLITWGSNMLSNGRQAASNTINAIVTFFAQLPGKIATWLTNAVSKVVSWGSQLAAQGRSAASQLVNAVTSGVAGLPGKMAEVGRNIVRGVWNGISNAAGWFKSQVRSFFSGIVDGAKSALGIHSPSKVFAKEVGKWIPPGVGEGIKGEMPELEDETNKEMKALAQKMQAAVNIETGKITLDKNTSQTYKVDQENGQSFDGKDTNVVIEGETHVHVDLDGKEIAEATTPYIDENLGKRYDLEERGV